MILVFNAVAVIKAKATTDAVSAVDETVRVNARFIKTMTVNKKIHADDDCAFITGMLKGV